MWHLLALKDEHGWKHVAFNTRGLLKLVSIGSLLVPVGLLVWCRLHRNQPSQQQGRRQRRRQESKITKAEMRALEKARREEERNAKRDRLQKEGSALLKRVKDKLACADAEQPIVFVALDVEAWEEDREKVTEIGLATFRLPVLSTAAEHNDVESQASSAKVADRGCFHHRHVLIAECLELRNGTHVEDNKDNFLFGDSEVLQLTDAVQEVQRELMAASFIVGHAMQGDLAWLRSIGVGGLDADAAELQSRLVDIQVLDAAQPGPSQDPLQPPSLRKFGDRFNLDPQRLHNAGNDAAFTLQVALCQCGVGFVAPLRSSSTHTASASFQAAWVDAERRMLDASTNWLQREEQLRAEVRAFAERSKACIGTSVATLDGGPVVDQILEHAFQELSAKERKVVHKAAEELGLHSVSRNDGVNGERCVYISRNAFDPLARKSPAGARRGRRHKKSGWHQHRGAGTGEAGDA